MTDVAEPASSQGIIRDDALRERVASGREVPIRLIDQIGPQHEHE